MIKKHFIAALFVLMCYAVSAQVSVPFSHGFETPSGSDFATGWTNIPTPGGGMWTRQTMGGFPEHNGRYARITVDPTPHNAWLISPGIAFTQGKTYRISFWLFLVPGGAGEQLQVKIGTSATPADITHTLFGNGGAAITPWTQISVDYTATTTANHFIGWHASSTPNAMIIDEVSVIEVVNNDLENITDYPYSRVPVSQHLPPARVRNIGFQAQTDIVLQAELNGATVGTSAPLATLASGATAELELTSAIPVPAGNNELIYTVSQTETDETPDNNIRTFSFEGTPNVFAVDEATLSSEGMEPFSSATSFGAIYTINQPVSLSQVIVGFEDATTLNYSLSLYALTSDLTTAATPLFTPQTATKQTAGWSYVTVPETLLNPGRYFLCLNQLSAGAIGVLRDGNTAKTTYRRESNGNLTPLAASTGAVAIRMAMKIPDCTVEQPTNLTVVSTHSSATFSWEGTAPLYFRLTLNDGTADRIYATTDNTFTVSELPIGVAFTWKVAAMCDAVSFAETTGTPFSTLACEVVLKTFPITEGFEDETFPPACWSVHSLIGGTTWARNTDDFYIHSGKASAWHNYTGSGMQESWLVMPAIEIPETGEFVLDFMSYNSSVNHHYNGISISTTGSNPATSTFTEVKQLTGNEVSANWKKITVPLSANYAGETVYIAFLYKGDFADQWYVDDVEIHDVSTFVDGEVAQILFPQESNINLTANERVKVLLKNNSGNPITGFEMELKLGNEIVATEPFTGSIAGFSEAEYTFNTSIDLSAEALYTLTVTAIIDNDDVLENNSKTLMAQNYVCTPTSLPLTEGFNSATFPPRCWTIYNTAGRLNWERAVVEEFSYAQHWSTYDDTEPEESWLVTPQIQIPAVGNALLEFQSFNRWYQYHKYGGIWVSTTGNDPTTSTFTEVKQLDGDEISDEWKKITVPLSADYAGQTIYVAFKYAGADGDQWFIGDVKIWDFYDYVEGEVATILTPISGDALTAGEEVKIHIKNNGSDPLTNFDLILELNGEEKATETYTGSIASLDEAEYTFDTKLNLSAAGDYAITVRLEVAADQEPENNTKTKHVTQFSTEVVELFGYRVYDLYDTIPEGFVSFKSDNPAVLTRVNDYMPEGVNSMYAGEYVDGDVYAYTITVYGPNLIPRHFLKISTETWTETFSYNTSVFPRDMAYDPTTQVMYGVFAETTRLSNLAIINMQTGATTIVGSLGRYAITLACCPQGNLFAIDSDGNLCAVDKTTGEATLIGFTGIEPFFVQSMAFDQATGRLFWAMCNANEDGEGRLVELSPTSGAAFDRGSIGGEAEIIGLFTKSTATAITMTTPEEKLITVYPNPVNDLLHIQTEERIQQILVSDLQGKVVKTFRGHHTAIDLQTLPAGFYVVRIHVGTTVISVKVVKN